MDAGCAEAIFTTFLRNVLRVPFALATNRVRGSGSIRTLTFLSDLIDQATVLVATAKFLASSQRDQFLALSQSAANLYKRVQRNRRILRNMPIPLYRETDSSDSSVEQELTNTVNVSKRGACIATKRAWTAGEKIWIRKPQGPLRALAQVTWLKETGPSQFLMGLQILDSEDFWGSESAPAVKKGCEFPLLY
jgi:PilZ domain